jgi:predicted metal-dependent phosphoesterase TrpH
MIPADGRQAQRAFDFHTHTRASDGASSPAELLGLAREAGLEGISITDHDTLDAYEEMSGGSSASGPWVLHGVELSTRHAGEELHVIGYFPDGIGAALRSYVEVVISERRARIAEGLERLRERGIELTLDDCARFVSGRIVSRNHVAQALVDKRYVSRAHHAYGDLLGPKTMPLPRLEALDAVGDIDRLGGISVWAHPSAEQSSGHLGAFLAAGLRGIEVVIPRRSPRERDALAAEARSRGLLVTGGSDWHGHRGSPALGKFRVFEDSVGPFLAAIGR